MTNRDMVPRPGKGPKPRDRSAPKGPKREDDRSSEREDGSPPFDLDPPDSPQVKPSQDRR